ncbi:MAG: FlgD immunoglobulin-like domain containing protein, partial [Candidatus Poribacteria bacterium]
HGGGIRDVFVAKLSSSGSTLIYSTYLGGSNDDGSIGIAVNSDGNAYVTGYTNSSGFPTQNPYDSSLGGNRDAFVASYLQDGSLPVELSLLTATASADGVIIRWRTESEVNNIGFVIYRSEKKDGNYTKIAFISGASNSAMPIDYQFTDKKVEAGKTYFYYLEDIDIAGEKNRLKIIRVVVPTAKSVLLVPKEFRLLQNYPNPFNPDTWLPYELAADATVTIRIYDVNGQLVRQLDLGVQKAGRYVDKEKAAYWDGKDQTGKTVPSGLYFYTLKAGDFQATRRMVIVK